MEMKISIQQQTKKKKKQKQNFINIYYKTVAYKKFMEMP